MEKDYSLLRPFDLEAAKRGEMVCWSEDGDIPKTFIATPEGNAVVSFDDSECFWRNYEVETYFRMAPLAWVEDRPVYKGDVLWHNSGCFVTAKSSRTYYYDGFVCEDGDEVHADNMKWQKPKTKREAWVNVYPNELASHYETKEEADCVARPTRIACCRIEWEE